MSLFSGQGRGQKRFNKAATPSEKVGRQEKTSGEKFIFVWAAVVQSGQPQQPAGRYPSYSAATKAMRTAGAAGDEPWRQKAFVRGLGGRSRPRGPPGLQGPTRPHSPAWSQTTSSKPNDYSA